MAEIMIKTLIADDESIIRNGLKKLVLKQEGFDVVALAEDGIEAVELINEHKPELVLLDINMPFLNGFEVIEKIKQIDEDIVIVIISGYDDFEYAKTAIKFGVFDYLLKPVTEDSLFEVLNKAKKSLDIVKNNINYLSFAKKQLEKNKKGLIRNVLIDWLDGSLSYDEVLQQCAFFEIELPSKPAISIIRIVNNVEETEWEDRLLNYACENIANEMLANFAPLHIVNNDMGDLVFINEDSEELEEQLLSLESALQLYLPIKVKSKTELVKNYMEIQHIYSTLVNSVYEDSKLPKILLDVKSYVEKNFSNPYLSLNEVSEALHISPQHISRLFKSSGIGTFGELLTSTRIRYAVKLLSNPDLKMYEVAELVGYSSQHYFSSTFKKIFGVSPAEYRKTKN